MIETLFIVALLAGFAQAEDSCLIELRVCDNPQNKSSYYISLAPNGPLSRGQEEEDLVNRLAQEIRTTIQVAKTTLRGMLSVGASAPAQSFQFVLQHGAQQIPVTTDSRGCFRVDGLLPGTYRVSAAQHRSFSKVFITESGCHSSTIVMDAWGLKEQAREAIEGAFSYGTTAFKFAREFIEQSISSSSPRK